MVAQLRPDKEHIYSHKGDVIALIFGKISRVSQAQNLIRSNSFFLVFEWGRFQMKIHSAPLQFKYSQRSWHKAIFDELFTAPELFVEFSIWKPDSWNRVAIAQASVIKAHWDLAEKKSVWISAAGTHIIFTLSSITAWVVAYFFFIVNIMWFSFDTPKG